MKKISLSSLQFFLLLAAAGLLLRLEYLREYAAELTFPFALGADVQEYNARARELLEGIFFPAQPDIHAPLYSYFLALVYAASGCRIPAARIVQLLLNWGSWFLGVAALRECQTPPLIRRIFFAVGMLLPVLFFHQAELVSESLLFPLLFAVLYFLNRAEKSTRFLRTLPAGLFTGLAVLTHGLVLPFAALETLVFLLRRRYRDALLFAVGILCCVLPVIAVKSCYYERFTGVQGNSSFNFWLGNTPDADGTCYLRPGLDWRKVHRQSELESARRGISVNRYFLEKVQDFYRKQPGRAILLFLKKACLVWSPQEQISGADPETLVRGTPLLYWSRAFLPLLFCFSLAGIWYLFRRRELRYRHYYLLFVSFYAAQILTVTSGRYRLGMMPAVLLFSACGIRNWPWKRFWYLPLLVLCTLWFLFPAQDPYRHEAWSLQGEAALLRGDLPLAEKLLSAAAEKSHDPARFENYAGLFCAQRGDWHGAERHYRNAIAGEPESENGYMNLAILIGNFPARQQEAEMLYRKALELAPGNGMLLFNYALFLHQNGKDAEAELRKAVFCDPKQAGAWNLLGILAMNKRDYREAVRCFTAACERAPQVAGYAQNKAAAENAARVSAVQECGR